MQVTPYAHLSFTPLGCLHPISWLPILFHGSSQPHEDSRFHSRPVFCLATAQVWRSRGTQEQSALQVVTLRWTGSASRLLGRWVLLGQSLEIDYLLFRRELLDTLPWVLWPSRMGATSVQSVVTALGLEDFSWCQSCTQLSHRGARASLPLQSSRVSCAIPPAPGQSSHLSSRKALFPSPVCVWGTPHCPPGAVLCAVRSSFQQVWAVWPEGTTSTMFHANNGINKAQPVERRHKPAVPLVSHWIVIFVSFLMCSTGLLHEAWRREENIPCNCL